MATIDVSGDTVSDDLVADVQARVARLIADNAAADADERTFLGAQFDAGLARIQNRIGDGGLGLPARLQEHVDEALEAVGRRYPWLRNPMGIGMVGPAIAAHGTAEQRQLLRAAFTAEEIWCQLFSEPGAGSDVATLATTAVRDGDEWIINGQKVWTSLAHRAKRGLLIARTDPDVPKHVGITAFIVDMHAPGVEIRPLRQMSGGAEFNEVFFTDVRVPDANRVDAEGKGWTVAVTTLMNERVSIGGVVEPRNSGPIGLALKVWETYLAGVGAGGGGVAGQVGGDGRGDARRDELMKLWVEAEVLRLGNIRAQARRELGTPGPEGSVLKLGGALLSQRIAHFTVSAMGPAALLHDGYALGRQDGDPVSSFLGAQASTIAGGTSEVMRNILGERVLGLPGEPRVDRDVAWSAIPKGV